MSFIGQETCDTIAMPTSNCTIRSYISQFAITKYDSIMGNYFVLQRGNFFQVDTLNMFHSVVSTLTNRDQKCLWGGAHAARVRKKIFSFPAI